MLRELCCSYANLQWTEVIKNSFEKMLVVNVPIEVNENG